MIEVEAKVKITNPKKIRKEIKAIAKYKGKVIKTDDYYTTGSLKKYSKKSLRIRKLNKHYQINFKQRISYIKGVHAKKESEFTVSDIENFIALIKDMGYKRWLTKHKISEIYQIKKNFNIEINYVKRLGWFLEIEYLTTPSKIKQASAQIQKVMKKLNIKISQIEKSGYTKMLWDKQSSTQ